MRACRRAPCRPLTAPRQIARNNNAHTLAAVPSLLPKLAELFHITTDELLGAQKQTVAAVDPEAVDPSKMLLRIRVLSGNGDKVNINLPLALAELLLSDGNLNLFSSDKGGDAMKNIDFKQIFALVKQGVVGKLVEIESSDGDRVEVFVE